METFYGGFLRIQAAVTRLIQAYANLLFLYLKIGISPYKIAINYLLPAGYLCYLLI